jgi:O-antigen ligase
MTKDSRNKIQEKPRETESLLYRASDSMIFLLILFTVLSLPLFFNIMSFDQFELPKLTLLRILTCALLALWAVKTAEKGVFEYTPTPLDLPLLIWTILNVVTTFTSFAPHLSFRGEYENFAGSLTNINYVVLYFIASQNIKSDRQIKAVAYTVLTSGILITIYSIAQFFGHDFVNWNQGSMISGRYFASMGNPNFLGALLTMMIPFGISFAIDGFKYREKTYIFQFGYIKISKPVFAFFNIIVLIFMYIALFGTQSRGPMAAFAASIAVYAVYGYYTLKKEISSGNPGVKTGFFTVIIVTIKNHFRAVIVILAAALIALTLSLTVGIDATNRLTSSIMHPEKSFETSRLHIWIPAMRMIRDNPILGTGVDTFKSVFPMYEGTNFAMIDGENVSSRTAHNELLNIAATMGLTALGVYLLLIFAYFVMWYRSFLRTPDGIIKWISFAAFAGVVAYLVQNLVSFGVAAINTYFYIFFAVHAALYARYYNTKVKRMVLYKKDSPHGWLVQYLIIFCAIFLAALLGYKAYMMYSADVHYNKGKILGNVSNRWDLAVGEHIKSVEAEPHEVKYYVYLGLAYERLAMMTQDKNTQLDLIHKAAEAYQRGVELNPGNSYYWGNLGRIYTMMGKVENPKYFENAQNYYQTAISKAPVTGLFYSNLIELYIGLGMIDKAFPLMTKLESYDKKLAADSYFLLGNVYFGSKQFVNAENSYKKSIELNPEQAETYYNLGIVCAALGDKNGTKSSMEKYLEMSPDSQKAPDAKKLLKEVSR